LSTLVYPHSVLNLIDAVHSKEFCRLLLEFGQITSRLVSVVHQILGDQIKRVVNRDAWIQNLIDKSGPVDMVVTLKHLLFEGITESAHHASALMTLFLILAEFGEVFFVVLADFWPQR
jgi:hypothetical protein